MNPQLLKNEQESINPKAATGGHHGDVIRGMQTQQRVQQQQQQQQQGGDEHGGSGSGKQMKAKTNVPRSLVSLMTRGAKALKNESDSLAMKRWIKWVVVVVVFCAA